MGEMNSLIGTPIALNICTITTEALLNHITEGTQSQQSTNTPQSSQDSSTANVIIQQSKGCNCKNSLCLKAYCPCFHSNNMCIPSICFCQNCQNIPQSNGAVPKYKKQKRLLTKECSCQKSECANNYCECRSNGRACGVSCTCMNCKNKERLKSDDKTSSLQQKSEKMKKNIQKHQRNKTTISHTTFKETVPVDIEFGGSELIYLDSP